MKTACVLITHLPIKAELQRYTHLRGKPVIITESFGSKQVVLDRSSEAVGIIAGMPLQEALSRCKGATLLQADQPRYNAVFDQITGVLTQRSPLVEKGELGCIYVGLDGLEEMYGGEARLLASLLQATSQCFSPRIGLGQGKFPAYVAAMASIGGQATKVPQDVAIFLSAFPLDLLPISWDSKHRLHRFGIHSMGQLASLSIGSIQAQLGVEGRKAWELANGIDHSLLLPYKSEEEVSEYLVFPSPVITLHTIVLAIETLLGRAFTRVSLLGKYVRKAALESQVLRKPPWTRRFAFKEAVNSREKAFLGLKSALETVSLPGPLEDMKLTLSGFAGESGIQASLFADIRRQEQLRETMRQLEARLGCKPPIYQLREIEPWSRVPERRQALVQFAP